MTANDLIDMPIRAFHQQDSDFFYVVLPVLSGDLALNLVVSTNIARLYEISCNDVIIGYKLRVKPGTNIGRACSNIVAGHVDSAQPDRADPLELVRVERRATLELLFAYNSSMFSLMCPTKVNYVPQKEQ